MRSRDNENSNSLLFQTSRNTKTLLDGIVAAADVNLINMTTTKNAVFSGINRIGFASGFYYGTFANQTQGFVAENLPEDKQVFLITTCGSPRKGYFSAMEKIAADKNCCMIGKYGFLGFDTFEPFNLLEACRKAI